MDPIPRSIPEDRRDRIALILQRTSALTGPEIVALTRAYDTAQRPDERDLSPGERRHARARIVRIATARSAWRREARELASSASSAVRAAARGDGDAHRLAVLGLLDGADLAVADAALAILLEEHLSREVADALGAPFRTVTSSAAAEVGGAGR